MFKKIFWKHILIYILTFCFAVSGLSLLSVVSAQDLMEQAFQTAREYDTIINLWNTKDSVWNEVLRESVSMWVNENFGQGCFINWQFLNVDRSQCDERGGDWDIQLISAESNPPLLVRITKFLLRMTIVLAITMIIFNSVTYLVEVLNGKDRKSAEAKKNIMRVAWGVIIALMSVGIINLVVSIPKSSIQTSDDLSSFEIWCKVGTTIVAWSDLKKRVCINVFEWTRKQDRIWNRCKINWDREPVRNDDMESACINEMEGTVVK